MPSNIKHLGIVESINGTRLKVRIEQTSACAACSVKQHCHVPESKEKIIDVCNPQGVVCAVGQKILISGTTAMGMKAVLLAFVFPFLVLLLALASVLHLTHNELVSALAALGALVPYYLIIYICRKRLNRSFIFRLENVV